MKITRQQLINECVSQEQIGFFVELFRDEVEITVDLCLSTMDKFDWKWAANILLDESNKIEYDRIYNSSWAENDKICEPAWIDYVKACDLALEDYMKICNSALPKIGSQILLGYSAQAEHRRIRESTRVDYEKRCASALAKYEKICAPAWAENDKICAKTFAELYNQQGVSNGY